jgi:hypothetical protein
MVEKTEDFLTEKGRSVAIKRCTCYSLFQDKRYGVGLRLHNRKAKGTTSWRCTVCGKEK